MIINIHRMNLADQNKLNARTYYYHDNRYSVYDNYFVNSHDLDILMETQFYYSYVALNHVWY